MRIEKITLRNFRGVKESTVEFGPGVTVVAGPNEVGKSSIAEALRLVRSAKHSSRAGAIRALQPVGQDVGPEVELEFTSHGNQVWVRKQWLRDAATELRITGAINEQLSGDEAHERLGTFLEEHIDVDLFDALEVLQGESLEEARFVGLKSLSGALSETGEVATDHDDLIEKVETEYAKHFTATGRPRGDYQRLIKDVEELELQQADALEQNREMDRFTEDVARAQAQYLDDEADLVEAQEELQRCEQRDGALTGLRQAVTLAAEEVQSATSTIEAAQAASQAREKLRNEVAERHAALADVEEKLKTKQVLLEQLTKESVSKRTVRDEAQTRAKQTRERATEASLAVESAVEREELKTLTSRVVAATEARKNILAATTVIENNHVDADLLTRIIEQHTALNIAQAARDAAAATVTVVPLGGEVHVNGEDVTDETDFSLASPMSIESPGNVRIDVTPGVLPEDLEVAVQETHDALNTSLEEGKVASVEEARESAAVRSKAEADKRLAEQALATALGEDKFDVLHERREVLASRHEDAEEEVNLDELRVDAADALKQAEDAAEELTEAHDQYEEHSRLVTEANESMIGLRNTAEHYEAEHKRAQVSLQEAQKTTSDESLAADLTQAESRVEAAAGRLKEATDALEEANAEAVELELANAKAWSTSAQDRLNDTATRIERASALLEDRAKMGLYERLQDAEGQLAAAKDALARIERRARSVQLLREVLLRHRDEAHARYVAPFAERITSLGRIVFGPDFAVEITPDLSIGSRTLDGRTVPFDYLSAGAREQLGLIGRLAAAGLVDPVEGAPVILDDTLGFADEDRLSALGAVLNDVGKRAQIILLTCQPRRFSRIGEATMVHLSPS